jgi:hypothetical protein
MLTDGHARRGGEFSADPDSRMDCRVKPGNDDLLVTRFDLKRVTEPT